MNDGRPRKGRAFWGLTGVVVVALLGVFAWQRAAAQRPVMAEDVFTNVTELRGIPVDEFMGTMGFFSASLGLNCSDCHSEQSGGSWPHYADDIPRKRMSRVMIRMVKAINDANFNGVPKVTCYTCHRGRTRPNVMPSLDALYSPPPEDEPGDPIAAAPDQPTVDAIFAKYLQAVGGATRAAGLKGLRMTGSYLGFDDLEKLPLEVVMTADGQRSTLVQTPFGPRRTVLDGARSWIAAPDVEKPVPLMAYTGGEVEGQRLENLPFFPMKMSTALTSWRVGYPALLADRSVHVVQGQMASGGQATLCFDEETGLLVRLIYFEPSPVGRVVTRVEYSDYRDAAGVKVPFKWSVVWLDGRGKYEVDAVQPNPAVTAAQFAQPPRSTPPPVASAGGR